MLRPAQACRSRAGHGPTVSITRIGGTIVVGLAPWLQRASAPPVWVHIPVWLRNAPIVRIGMLLPLKGVPGVQRYKLRAEEGRPQT